MSSELLTHLHQNLWVSLRHTFNTDRILLAVTYLINFSSLIFMLILLPRMIVAATVSAICILVINTLIVLSFKNSQKEVTHLVHTLSSVYADNSLGKYFDEKQHAYYNRRYSLWQALVPTLAISAIIIPVSITFIA